MDANSQLDKNRVFAILAEEIVTQQLGPGEALPERRLVQRFGLSRTPIREILRRLHNEYLVEVYPNRGAYVRSLTPANARDLFQMRETLEPFAARLAAEFRPDDEVAALLARFSDEGVISKMGPQQLAELGEALHDAIAVWSSNALYANMYGILRRQTQRLRAMTRTRIEIETASLGEHRAIVRAIAEGKSEQAYLAMEQHLRRSHTAVLAGLQAHRQAGDAPGTLDSINQPPPDGRVSAAHNRHSVDRESRADASHRERSR